MQKTKLEYYELIKDLISKEDFEKELKKRFAEYSELIPEASLAFMLVDELGRKYTATFKNKRVKGKPGFYRLGYCNAHLRLQKNSQERMGPWVG
ncbi:MAG: hypothetical protein QMC98_03050 [Candidatus Thermoplasmatota archaeon]|nr:hypothetical protein [Candidatus Thermoplasmatota archaeon]